MIRRLPPNVAANFFSEKPIRRRIGLIGAVYFCFGLLILARSGMLHLTEDKQVRRLAKNQYHKTVLESPKRGSIFDKNGEELAIDVQLDSLYADPSQIESPSLIAQKLAPILNQPKDKIEKLFLNADPKSQFIWIKRQLTAEESKKILELKEKGFGFRKEHKRFYPNKKLAANLLGAVGIDSAALGGLELYYDNDLKLTSEAVVVNRDAKGQSYVPDQLMSKQEPYHLELTLDKTIQFITEKALAKAVQDSNAESGVAIVMDVKTGEILAMASKPDFDPNEFGKYDLNHWKNRAIVDSFEPGSIFKGVTAALALESGKISAAQKINCEGGDYKVGDHTIHDHGHYGALSLPEIIKVSSNIGVFKISQMLGREEMGQGVLHFGFGKKTGIDLPGEVSGILAPYRNWSPVQQGTIAFGQGISVTPLQIINAYTAIANGGYLMKPFMVKRIKDSKGNIIHENGPQTLRQLMSQSTATQVTEMLKLVVSGSGGTGKAADVPEYGVAGKTGTAQKVTEGRGRHGYAEGKFTASFVGFSPADHPKIAVLVSINEPKGNHFGGVVAAPAFAEIVKQTLPYLKVAPKTPGAPMIMTRANTPETDPQNEGVDPAPVKKQKTQQNTKTTKPVAVVAADNEENHENTANTAPAEITEVKPGFYRLPDFTGKSLRAVMKEWNSDQLKLDTEGSGFCVEQRPAAGKILPKGSPVKLVFGSSS